MPSSISAALSASQPARAALGRPVSDDASDNTPRGPLWPFPEEKHRPPGVACAARRARGEGGRGGRAEDADLCRGQGFRRTAPSAPPRPEDRHVQGPPGAEEEGILIGFGDKAPLLAASARIWPTSGPTVP